MNGFGKHHSSHDTNAVVIRHALANPFSRAILERLAILAVPDAWLVSGCIFQSVWNGLTGRATDYGILDYDVFYFDPETSLEAEDAMIRRCGAAFGDLGVEVQVRNQARVHLWYPEKFGRPYPKLQSAVEGLTRFLAPCCAVGLKLEDGEPRLAAPFGLDDLMAMRVRPNSAIGGSSEQYDRKTARWQVRWPEITVLPWTDGTLP